MVVRDAAASSCLQGCGLCNFCPDCHLLCTPWHSQAECGWLAALSARPPGAAKDRRREVAESRGVGEGGGARGGGVPRQHVGGHEKQRACVRQGTLEDAARNEASVRKVKAVGQLQHAGGEGTDGVRAGGGAGAPLGIYLRLALRWAATQRLGAAPMRHAAFGDASEEARAREADEEEPEAHPRSCHAAGNGACNGRAQSDRAAGGRAPGAEGRHHSDKWGLGCTHCYGRCGCVERMCAPETQLLPKQVCAGGARLDVRVCVYTRGRRTSMMLAM